MKETFRLMPPPLQSLILFRGSGILLGILIFVFALLTERSWMLMLPGILLAIVSAASAYSLLRQYRSGSILAIEGTCAGIERTAFRKRIQAIYLQTGEHDIKIITHKSPYPTPAPGDPLIVYILKTTAVYEMDGYQVLCSCLALQKGRPPKQKLTH